MAILKSLFLLIALSLGIASNLIAQDSSIPAVHRLTKSYFSKFFLTYSPDGTHLIYSRHYDNRRAANKILMGLRIVRSDGTDDRPLMPEFDAQVQIQEHPRIAPDGKRMYLTGGGNDTGNAAKDLFVCDLDPEFKATNLRKLVPGEGVTVGEQAGLSPDGRELVVTDTSHNLWIVGSDGQGKRKLIQSGGNYCFQQTWSPDGEWIAFTSDRDGNSEIYKIRSDGTELTRLIENPAFDCRPQWSPDGRWMAFVSNRGGNEDIYVMRADGHDVRRLTDHPSFDDHPVFSPDGKNLVFISMRDGGFDLYRMSVPPELDIGAKPDLKVVPTTESSDLVAAYTFDNDQGAVIRDHAGRNTMTLFQTELLTSNGRGCLRLNGQSSYASIGNGRPLHLAGPMTISFWVKLQSVQGNGYIVSKLGFNVYVGTDLIPRFETRNAANSAWMTLASKTPIGVDRWSHIACVFSPDESVLSIYVDGKIAGRMERLDGKLGAVDGLPFEIGHYVASKTQKLNGDFDELRIYRKALTSEEILQLFEEQHSRIGVD